MPCITILHFANGRVLVMSAEHSKADFVPALLQCPSAKRASAIFQTPSLPATIAAGLSARFFFYWDVPSPPLGLALCQR